MIKNKKRLINLHPIGTSKAVGLWGATIQIITGIYLISIYQVFFRSPVRDFGLDYTLYDLFAIPPFVSGIILIVAGVISTLVLLGRIEIYLDLRVNILVFTGFLGNGLGGLLVFTAGVLLSVYEQKYDKDWPDDLEEDDEE